MFYSAVKQEILCLLVLSSLSELQSLSKIAMRIPTFVQSGESADLTCSYYLDSNSLYSIKWYKGRHEFYRYMPGEDPPTRVFPVKGMKINMTASDHVRVVLEDVVSSLSGEYLCEVTVTPTYFAMAETANMTVIDFPSRGPEIVVGRPEYQAGEQVGASCTVPASNPFSTLAWYINDEPASDLYVSRLTDYGINSENRQRLDLKFPVLQSHFKNGRVKLKCLATIAGLYWKTAEINLTQEHPKVFPIFEGADPSASRSSPGTVPYAEMGFEFSLIFWYSFQQYFRP
ncbi:uncharacterized protein LOC111697621 [Eurytemora carolleeae]|uniref:uncharacterized protein LOC111697621 n=1 Tax=Eurytemora carolleeae TaxID=1294199 RepID=UPI000C765461|nr:uncharacterized protein LOC111697621 [Eurytemora carolleeae]|eukprot:XP_023323490.1 uncharacterized protein LOC111697621 [Eurytemora affinis]